MLSCCPVLSFSVLHTVLVDGSSVDVVVHWWEQNPGSDMLDSKCSTTEPRPQVIIGGF